MSNLTIFSTKTKCAVTVGAGAFPKNSPYFQLESTGKRRMRVYGTLSDKSWLGPHGTYHRVTKHVAAEQQFSIEPIQDSLRGCQKFVASLESSFHHPGTLPNPRHLHFCKPLFKPGLPSFICPDHEDVVVHVAPEDLQYELLEMIDGQTGDDLDHVDLEVGDSVAVEFICKRRRVQRHGAKHPHHAFQLIPTKLVCFKDSDVTIYKVD